MRKCVASHGAGRMVWILLACMPLLFPSLLKADVIYLKNGGKIVAQVTKEDAKQVFYEMGGGEFALPKSLVERIEKSVTPAASPQQDEPRPGRELSLPLPLPADAEIEKGSAVIHDGAVDEAYLTHLGDEALHNPSPENLHQLKRAYQQAAVFLTRQGDPEAAILKYRDAIKYLPHDQALTLALGYLLTKQDHYLEAVGLLRPEANRYPRSPDFHVLLGSAYYGMENLNQAIAEWNQALALADDPRLRKAIEKAELERDVSASYSELRSEHFLLR
jgi:tetratricopeptide (TPR) repeat protein